MAILSFRLYSVFIVRVPFLAGVCGRIWNSIVSIPDNRLFILDLQFDLRKMFLLIPLLTSIQRTPIQFCNILRCLCVHFWSFETIGFRHPKAEYR